MIVATTGDRELDGFIAKYTPEVEALAHALLAGVRARIPGALMPVYDNYNALAIGFGPTDRVKHVILSLAIMPRWVTLCFTWGVNLDDPHRLLKGIGNQVRSVQLHAADALDDPRIEALIAQALANADPPVDLDAAGGIIIKSISAKQRPRRPVGR
jgi:hypothetical protein